VTGRARPFAAARAVAVAASLLLLAAAAATIAAKPAPRASASGPRKAPAIDLKRWINTKRLAPRDLEGKVRLVEFWTFGCVNCQNTILAMRELHGLYAKKGLLVLGVHSPEFPRERDSSAVAAAVKKAGIGFPVALDNDHVVFDAFKNRYWPALYLIDRQGIVRATHAGELHVGTRAWTNFCAAVESTLVARTERRS